MRFFESQIRDFGCDTVSIPPIVSRETVDAINTRVSANAKSSMTVFVPIFFPRMWAGYTKIDADALRYRLVF